MAEINSTALAEVGATTDPINDLFHESAYYWGRMNAFFELVERDIKERNSTDLDTIAFLVIGAKAEFDRFSKLISQTDLHFEEKCSAGGIPADSETCIVATDEPTSSDKAAESQLLKEFSVNCDPFSVFYSVGTGLKWAINDEEGEAIAESANYEDAVKISKAFRAAAYLAAVKAAQEFGAGAVA